MLTKDNTYKVMKLFFETPEKSFHLREAARLTNLSPPGASKILKKLEKETLIKIEKGDVVDSIKSSGNEKFIMLKKCYNIFSIFDSGLLDLLKKKYEEPEAIVLFGSYSKGEDTSTSDIDIAIITSKKLNLNLSQFETKLKRKISLHEIILKNAEKEFLNTLANGSVIHGYLNVIK